MQEAPFDNTNLKCDNCEEQEAVLLCLNCDSNLCAGCHYTHRRSMTSAHHRYVVIELPQAAGVEKIAPRRDFNTLQAQPVLRIGEKGSATGQFSSPYAVATNSRGEIIVADTVNQRIQVLDEAGTFLFAFGTPGQGEGEFKDPYCVSVDPKSNNILVSEYGNHRVQVFDEKGKFLFTFGSVGAGNGQFYGPLGAVCDRRGNYIVADYHVHRVQMFTPEGRFLRKIGVPGNGNGQICNPRGIGLFSSGEIVIADNGNKRISVFDSQGIFLRTFGDASQLMNPWQIFVDANDNVLVADFCNDSRVQVYNRDGNLIKTIALEESSFPSGVSLDRNGRVVVSEGIGQRITIFN